MKVRTQQNFNRKTRETVFGISIMPDGGRRYCKYPIGHQEYKDYTQAHQAMKDVQKILDNGGRLVYSSFYVNMVRFLTAHIATMYGSAWMVISMTRTKVTQFTLQ